MKKTIQKVGVLIVALLSQFTNAQGCSDAGFCTLSSFKPNTETSPAANQIKLGLFLGSADQSVSVWGNYLEYNRQFSEKFSLNTKLTTLSQNGNGYSNFGLGDLFLNANLTIAPKLLLTFGTKIPLTQANKKENNLALPMDYQSSLGTFDAIVGLGYQIKKLQLVLALQQPLTQNKNEFLAESANTPTVLKTFFSTRQFKRSADLMLRVAYPFTLSDSFQLTTGVLPVYHLNNDRYTDLSGVERTIQGSQGLTLNGNLFLDYKINATQALQLNLGMPFVVRDARPDGLTRGFIATVEYKINF